MKKLKLTNTKIQKSQKERKKKQQHLREKSNGDSKQFSATEKPCRGRRRDDSEMTSQMISRRKKNKSKKNKRKIKLLKRSLREINLKSRILTN